MAESKKYSFSFTGANAVISETRIIAQEYVRLKNWEEVKTLIDNQNLLNKIKQATFEREFREIKKRLILLTNDQMNLLVEGSPDETKAMIFLSLLKLYLFLQDFVIEVVRNKYLLFDNTLSDVDYNKFFNSKAMTHKELNELSELTVKKVRQVVFRVLEQIDLITSLKDGLIIKPYLSPECIKVIIQDDAKLLFAFLMSDSEIKAHIKSYKNV